MDRSRRNTSGTTTRAGIALSGRAPRGRRRARRDTEPMGPARPPAMTPEEKRAYYEGPKPTREEIQRILRGSYSTGGRIGYKASELGLTPGDWDDPRYRMAYDHFMILREDVEDEGSKDPYDDLELDLPCASD